MLGMLSTWNLLGLVLFFVRASARCPGLTIDLKTTAPFSRTYAGHPISISAIVKNTGSTQLTNVGVGLYLPNGLCVSNIGVGAALKPKHRPILEGNNVYWTKIGLKPKKKAVFSVTTRVATNLTTATTLSVSSVAWLPESNCSTTMMSHNVSTCICTAILCLQRRQRRLWCYCSL